jgi:hypothetical protein
MYTLVHASGLSSPGLQVVTPRMHTCAANSHASTSYNCMCVSKTITVSVEVPALRSLGRTELPYVCEFCSSVS